MLFAEFKERIESTYKAVFPNSRCCCRVIKCLGKSIDIHCVFTKDNKECASGFHFFCTKEQAEKHNM